MHQCLASMLVLRLMTFRLCFFACNCCTSFRRRLFKSSIEPLNELTILKFKNTMCFIYGPLYNFDALLQVMENFFRFSSLRKVNGRLVKQHFSMQG